jgi:hypothetical protein
MFSSWKTSSIFEQVQISEYMNLDLKDDDILFMSDLSFPGLFSNILYHKKPKRCFAYCHATSLNSHDYFEPVRYSKYPCEVAHSKLFNSIFVGSEYHKNKLGWNNIKVIGVPVPQYFLWSLKKEYDIISVSRPSIQKVNKKLEKKVERNFGKIIRKDCNSWSEYYQFLSEAKVVLLSGKEETFGYQVMEAIMNNSTPLAPNKYSYPELLTKDYLYDDYDELRFKIWQVLNGQLLPPVKLKNQDLCNNFYKNLVGEMLK